MEAMTTQDLQDHLQTLEVSTDEDRDELLTDLLVLCYPSRSVQNS